MRTQKPLIRGFQRGMGTLVARRERASDWDHCQLSPCLPVLGMTWLEEKRAKQTRSHPLPAAPAPSAHRSSERACPALSALRGRGRSAWRWRRRPAQSSAGQKSPPVLRVGGWSPTPSARGTYHCVPPRPFLLAAQRLRPFPNEAAPTLPAAAPHLHPNAA